MMMKPWVLSISIVAGVLPAYAQQERNERMCRENRKNLIQKVSNAAGDPAREKQGINPIFWAYADDMQLRVKNFNELAEKIYDLNPDDRQWARASDPQPSGTEEARSTEFRARLRTVRIETIRKTLRENVRLDWVKKLQAKDLKGLRSALLEAHPNLRFSDEALTSNAGGQDTWTFTLKNDAGAKVTYAFDVRGEHRGNFRIERSVGGRATASDEALKGLIDHAFDAREIRLNLPQATRQADLRGFTKGVLRYLDTHGIWKNAGLTPDHLTRLVGRDVPALTAEITAEVARTSTRARFWIAYDALVARAARMKRWQVAAALGGIAAVSGFIAWFWDSDDNGIEERVQRAIAYMDEHYPGMGSNDRKAMKKELTALIEDGGFQDRDALVQTIGGMPCDKVTALYYFVVFNKDLVAAN